MTAPCEDKDCPSLPSSEHAAALFKDARLARAIPVASDWLLRAGLIGTGIFLAGERNPFRLALYALSGSAVVETFVLAYIGRKEIKE